MVVVVVTVEICRYHTRWCYDTLLAIRPDRLPNSYTKPSQRSWRRIRTSHCRARMLQVHVCMEGQGKGAWGWGVERRRRR